MTSENREDHLFVSQYADMKWHMVPSRIWICTPDDGVEYRIVKQRFTGDNWTYLLYCNGARLGRNTAFKALKEEAAQHWEQFRKVPSAKKPEYVSQ